MDTTMSLTFGERLQGSFEQLYGYVPALFGALVILFAGYLLARLLEKGTDRLMRRIRFNQILEKGGVMQAVERSGSHVNPTRVAGSLVFWFVMFAVMLVAANALGLQSLANVFSELVSYIPSVIASIVIMIVGIVLGGFVGGLDQGVGGRIARRADAGARGKGWRAAARDFMALQELGVATEIVTTAFAILFGAIALALSLSFGLGNRDLAGRSHSQLVRALPRGARDDRPRQPRDRPRRGDLDRRGIRAASHHPAARRDSDDTARHRCDADTAARFGARRRRSP